MELVTIVPLFKVISFGLGSSMPMGAHESITIEHRCRSGKGIKTISNGFKVPTHSLNIQIVCTSTFGKLHPLVHANKGLIIHNILHYCRYPSPGLATKARGCKVAGQE